MLSFVLIAALLLFLVGCNKSNNVACTEDAKICPDGTAVGRIPPNCEFAECPEETPKDATSTVTEGCDYEQEDKNYIGKSQEECSRIKFVCEPSMEYFSDECGCGCRIKDNKGELSEHYCTPEQKKAEICIQIYQPVCGWFDSNQIQCTRYPCSQTFSNSCFACSDEKVLYWTEGECPN